MKGVLVPGQWMTFDTDDQVAIDDLRRLFKECGRSEEAAYDAAEVSLFSFYYEQFQRQEVRA